jgi:type VI secretion system VasD/TssJ family lipoprotein
MTGQVKVLRSETMGKFAAKPRAWMCVLCISMLLTGCSLIPDNLFKTKQPQPVKQNIDTWVDNISAWKSWDVNDPNNEFTSWSRGEDAIEVKFVASSELNSFSQRAHTLTVKVVQLTELSGLNTLLQTPDGITQVLSHPVEMIPNAVISETYVLAPSQTVTYHFAREENSKYIAVVAGFAELAKKSSVKIIPISIQAIPQKPIEAEWTILDQLTMGYFVEKELQPDVIRPSKIKLNIRLGESGITRFSATAS